MDEIGFYGIYRTRNATATKALATTRQSSNRFPPSIAYKDEAYTLQRAVQVSTPSQERAFLLYCQDHHLETDVNF